MAPSESYIPPVSPQAPANVLTTSMSLTDPARLAGTIVPLAQQTQPPATPMQLTDIIPQAAPQQTQPVMVPQQTIVQQQQTRMDHQTTTLHQQSQQQMEPQATVLEQQIIATHPSMEQHQQRLSATAVHHEPQQQMYVQPPPPPVQPTPQQQALTSQMGMDQQAMSLAQTGEQPQSHKQQLTRDPREQVAIQSQQLQQQQTLIQQQQQALLLEQHQMYVQQQLDQQQQQALLQQQQQQQQAQLQQHQLEQQQALMHKQFLEQQQQQALIQQQQEQQGLVPQEQPNQALLQQQPPPQQQMPSQLYHQIGHQAGMINEPENQMQGGQQQQHIVLQHPPQQTQPQNEQHLQQQVLLRQMEQQQQQAVIQQHLQQQAILQQQQLQQNAQLQLQQQEQQQVHLKQHIEHQQQTLLQQQLEKQQQQQVVLQQQVERLQQQIQEQQQQQAAIIHLQQTESQEALSVSSKSEQQPNLPQQRLIEQQQNTAPVQKLTFVAQPQHHTPVMDSYIPVAAPVGIEMVQHQKQVVSLAQVPMAVQAAQISLQTSAQVLTQQGLSEVHLQHQGQVPAQFMAQSTAQATQSEVTPPAAVIQAQTQITQTQQIPLQTSYLGPVTPAQSQVTAPPLIQPLRPAITQSQPPLGQAVDIHMMGQQSQLTVQPPATIASIPSQIQHLQQNTHVPGVMQHQVQQQAQAQQLSQVQAQAAAGLLTPQYFPQVTHQAIQPVQQDITHLAQLQLQKPVLQYQQMILSPCSGGSVGTKPDNVNSVDDPANFVITPHSMQTTGQAYVPGPTTLHSLVQPHQQNLGSSADPSVVQPISQPTVVQSTEQYQPQLQKLSQVQLPLAPPSVQTQLLAQPITTPNQQPILVNQALMPLDESQPPPQCPPVSHLVTYPPAQIVSNVTETQNKAPPLYSHLLAGVPSSPQHHAKHMAHTQIQTSSHTLTHIQTQAQTHTEAPIAEQPVLPHAVFPSQQMPPSPSHTSCPPTSLSPFPSQHPAASPAPVLPSSPPAAQVTLPGQTNFMPTSPTPVTPLQVLDSNTSKLPQASLQDCDLSLLGIAQVQED